MKTKAKHYLVVCKAGVPERPAPGGRRIALAIQNTGSNVGRVRIDNDVRNDGGDMILSPGSWSPKFDVAETCPNGSLNFLSADGTTFSVVEVIEVA